MALEYDCIQDFSYNAFTDTCTLIPIGYAGCACEVRTIPASSPYIVSLYHAPVENVPSYTDIYIGATQLTEVAKTQCPSNNQYRVNYDEKGRGQVEFHANQASCDAKICYCHVGTLVSKDALDVRLNVYCGVDRALCAFASNTCGLYATAANQAVYACVTIAKALQGLAACETIWGQATGDCALVGISANCGLYTLVTANYGSYNWALGSYGVFGCAGVNFGVYGRAVCFGVYGCVTCNRGVNGRAVCYGVYGYATCDCGVYGNADCNYGVYGCASVNFGVCGRAACCYGISGYAGGCYGVYGCAVVNFGVFGRAVCYGVYGYATGDYGVCGRADGNYGVYGHAVCGGVYGHAEANCGVHGHAVCCGVFAYVTCNCGLYSFASCSYGVYGCAILNYGVYGRANGDYGVWGWACCCFGGMFCAYSGCFGVYSCACICYGGYFVACENYAAFGCAYGNYGIRGQAICHGASGQISDSYPVSGNGAYYDTTSNRNIKMNKEDISILDCFAAHSDFKVQKWQYADSNQRGFDYFISPYAEDIKCVFDLTFEDNGIYQVGGIALGATIELYKEQTKLKNKILILENRLKILEDK